MGSDRSLSIVGGGGIGSYPYPTDFRDDGETFAEYRIRKGIDTPPDIKKPKVHKQPKMTKLKVYGWTRDGWQQIAEEVVPTRIEDRPGYMAQITDRG